MQKVLVIEHNQLLLHTIRKEFTSHVKAELFFVSTLQEAKALIHAYPHEISVAVTNLSLPDAEQAQSVAFLNKHHIPTIVLTDSIEHLKNANIRQHRIVDHVLTSNHASIEYLHNIVNRVLNNPKHTVMIVDDSEVTHQIISLALEDSGLHLIKAKSALEGLDYLDKHPNRVSLILTDYSMPEMNGLEFVSKIRESYSKDQVAIIAISANDQADTIEDFMRYGANDFIQKPFSSSMLTIRINNSLDMIDSFVKIKHMAFRDFLTGAYNRRHFYDRAFDMLQEAHVNNASVCVAMLDIDHFKVINDSHGHDIGDLALKKVYPILQAYIDEESGMIARFGGEEFCILYMDKQRNELERTFENLRKRFETNRVFYTETDALSYTVSIGIYYGEALELDTMIKLSDNALYDAKQQGRNRINFYTA